MIGTLPAVEWSLTQFKAVFPDEETCARYLFRQRWPGGFACPDCKARRYTRLTTRAYTYECRCCGRQTSITALTVMHRTHLPLKFWFWAAHLIASHADSVSARRLEALLEVTYKTAWLLKQKLHRPLDRGPLEGRVEVGSSRIRFRGADILLDPAKSGMITIAAAISALEIRLAAIPDTSPRSIEEFVRSNVKPGATLLSNSNPNFTDYKHAPPEPGAVPRLAITFELLREYRRRGEALDRYLRKFVLSHNHRYREVSFDTLLGIASHHKPASYKDIIGTDNHLKSVKSDIC
jgi:hypothetical protein